MTCQQADGERAEGGELREEKSGNAAAGSPSLFLAAYRQQLPIANKAGYALNSEEFYSWLGAVLPHHPPTGIATRLREAQER